IDHREIYPVFTWDLFSTVPGNKSAYFLKVENTVIFGSRVSEYTSYNYPPEYFWEIQQLGQNFEENRNKLPLLEFGRYFVNKPVTFKLVKLDYNPVEFKKSEKVYSEKVIGSFLVK
ncbi:MAG: hypothetical protein ACHQUA_01830, partial [Microgenomates group bacterium]